MTDLIVILGIAAFFALLAGFVTVCDRIIGPDPSDLDREQAVLDALDEAEAARELATERAVQRALDRAAVGPSDDGSDR